MAEVNLCPNPTGAIDTTGWSAFVYPGDGVLSSTQVDGMTSPTAVRVTQADPDHEPNGVTYIYMPTVPAVAGTNYMVIFQVRMTGNSTLPAQVFINFANTAVLVRRYAWATFSPDVPRTVIAFGIAPVGATTVSAGILFQRKVSGQTVIDVSSVAYYVGTDLTRRYRDGDSVGWSWDGVRGLSTSRDTPTNEFADAITGGTRRAITSSRIDWDRDGCGNPLAQVDDVLVSLSTERSIASALPAEVGLVEGSVAARASLSLAGRWTSGADLDPVSRWSAGKVTPSDALAPYRPDAPLAQVTPIGAPVDVASGFITSVGRRLTPRFVGSVSSVDLDAVTRAASLTAIDGSNNLRSSIALPAHAADGLLVKKYGQAQYLHRINAQWIIDRILRANGVNASPPAPPNALIAATLHGSTIPEVGYGGRTVPIGAAPAGASAWAIAGHPFGMLYPNRTTTRMTGTWRRDIPTSLEPGKGIGFALWFYYDPSRTTLSASLVRVFCNGGVVCSVYNSSGLPVVALAGATASVGYGVNTNSAPTSPCWMFLGAHIAFTATTAQVFSRFNGQTATATYTLPVGFRSSQARIDTAVDFDTDVPFTNFSCWQASAPYDAEWPGESHVPVAKLDRANNELLGLPALDGEDSWSLLKEVVAAEFGTCGFDEEGLFRFRARTSVAEASAPVAITSDRELSDLVTKLDEAAVRNIVTASAAPYVIDKYEDVFSTAVVDQMDCGPGVTVFDFPVDPNVLIVAGNKLFFSFTEQEWSDADKYVYRDAARVCVVNSAAPQTGVDATSGKVTLANAITRPGNLRITVTNNTGVSIRFATKSAVDGNGVVTSDGQPAYKVGGRIVREQPEQTVTVSDEGSIVTYGERAYDLGGKSRFRQHLDSVSGIASAVLASTAQPAPVLDAITVPHDPRRKLRDRVKIVDRTGQGEIVGTIVGIKSTFDTKATDVLTVRPIGPPGLGILDDPTLGLIGSTLVFGA